MTNLGQRRWTQAALVLGFVFSFLVAAILVRQHIRQSFSPESVVTQVQKLSRLVTVRYSIQRVVGLKEEKQPFGEESILLMVQGEVQAGVELERLRTADIRFPGEHSVEIALPPARIFDAFLDERQTRVWDRHITWWTPWVPYDPDLEHKARLQAIDEIRHAALEMGILGQAQDGAQKALRDFFDALGWKATFKTRGLD